MRPPLVAIGSRPEGMNFTYLLPLAVAIGVWFISTGLFAFQISEVPDIQRLTALSTVIQQLFAFVLACVLAPMEVAAALSQFRAEGFIWTPSSATVVSSSGASASHVSGSSPTSSSSSSSLPRVPSSGTMTVFKSSVMVGVGHALGAYLTMVALAVAPVSIVQMTKSCEMVATVVLCAALAGTSTTWGVKRALAVAVLGVVVFSSQSSRNADGSAEANDTPTGVALGLVISWASNLSFGVRNVVPKLAVPPPKCPCLLFVLAVYSADRARCLFCCSCSLFILLFVLAVRA